MRKDIEKLRDQLIECVDRGHQYIDERDLQKAYRERIKARKIFKKMIRRGQEGVDACIKIAESDHYQAAILCCILAYDLDPQKCIRELKRISKTGTSMSRSLASTIKDMLRMGIRFDEL